jgi:hypothetical protein
MRGLRRLWVIPGFAAAGGAVLFACSNDNTGGGGDTTLLDATAGGPYVDSSPIESDGNSPVDANTDTGSSSDSGAPDADASSTVDSGDANAPKSPAECTGSGFGDTTNMTKMRVAPSGTLYVLEDGIQVTGKLHKFAVGGTDTCALTEDATFTVDGDLRDFDLDSAGNLWILEYTDNGVTIQQRDAGTGAALTKSCLYVPTSNAVFGLMAISPDGTKAVGVSAGSVSDDAGSDVYAFTATIGATCTTADWKPTDVAACTFGAGQDTIIAHALRMDSNNAYLACNSIAGYPFGAAAATVKLGDPGSDFFLDLAFTPKTYDGLEHSDAIRFDRGDASTRPTVSAQQYLGAAYPNPQTFPLSKVKLMTDPTLGERFVGVATEGLQTQKIYRINDF